MGPTLLNITPHRLIAIVVMIGLAACTPQQPAQQQWTEAARLRLAQAAEQSGDDQLAGSMYSAASAEAPTDADIQLRYADALVRRGEIPQARELLLRHMGSVSDPQKLAAGLAAIYVLNGDATEAVAEYDKLLAVKPDDPRYMVDKAVALDLVGRHDEAQVLYRRAQAANPDDAIVASDLALSLALSGHTHEAAAVVGQFRHSDNISPRLRNDIDVVLKAGGATSTADGGAAQDAIDQLSLGLVAGGPRSTGAHNP